VATIAAVAAEIIRNARLVVVLNYLSLRGVAGYRVRSERPLSLRCNGDEVGRGALHHVPCLLDAKSYGSSAVRPRLATLTSFPIRHRGTGFVLDTQRRRRSASAVSTSFGTRERDRFLGQWRRGVLCAPSRRLSKAQ
jgi:hypothetical protein